jgi:hypothetical protein
MKNDLAVFEEHQIRRVYDEEAETWFFSVIDIVKILTNHQTARKYWNKLKERLKKEGSETVTNCHQLKMTAEDGKSRLTDVANAETLLRLVQSIPSPKAEPIKLWLAKVGYERMQEMADPAKTLNRARETWQKHGYSEKSMSVSKNKKMEVLYSYLTGVEFKQRVEAIVEAFTSMDASLKKERLAYEKIWAEREKQIKKVITNTVGMYGDLSGLATLPLIKTLELGQDEDGENK